MTNRILWVATDNIGISGFQRLSYVFWPREVLGHQQMAFSSDWITPGRAV